jgi:apolipoprotein N-acyltransferase
MAFAFEGASLGFILQYFYLCVALSVLGGILFYLYKKNSCKQYVIAWFLGAFVFNLFSLSWLYTAYPIVWLPENWQLVAITLLLVIMALTASLFFPLVGFFHFRFRHKKLLLPLILGALVTVAETLRSLALSALFYAPGSATIGLHWSAGTFGNALAITPLVEYAHFGGVFFLSGILTILVALLFVRHTKTIGIYLACVVCGWFVVHTTIPTNTFAGEGIIGVVSLERDEIRRENDPKLYVEQKDLILSLVKNATVRPDTLVLPEDTRFLENLTSKDKQLLESFGVTAVIDSATTIHQYKLSNYSYVYDTKTTVLQGRGKWFLFPFNEYTPLVFKTILSLWFSDEEIQGYTKEHTYASGKVPQVFETSYGNVGTLLCSEMFSHGAISSFTDGQASFIVLQSHLPVFHKNPWLFMSYYLIAQTIAAQTRSHLFVSSTDAPTLLISPYGNIIFRGEISSSLFLFRVDREGVSLIK